MNSTFRKAVSQKPAPPLFNKVELVAELKEAMRSELEIKLKKTEKDFVDLKTRVN
jgi:hypothetical protein